MDKADVLDATGELLGEAFRLLRASWQVALLSVSVSTAAGWWFERHTGGFAVEGALDLILGYLLVANMLRMGGLAPDGLKGGLFSYFLVWLVSGLGLALGILLLVIPGIYLAVRWMPALSYALVGDQGVNGSLRSAWDATSQAFWPILAALAFFSVPMLLAIVLTVRAPEDLEAFASFWSLTRQLLASLSLTALTGLGVAVFSLAERGNRIEEVFG